MPTIIGSYVLFYAVMPKCLGRLKFAGFIVWNRGLSDERSWSSVNAIYYK